MNIKKTWEYKIIGVKDDFIMLADEGNNWFNVSMDILEKQFAYSYCCICHSLQGSSKSGIITVQEWNHFWLRKIGFIQQLYEREI